MIRTIKLLFVALLLVCCMTGSVGGHVFAAPTPEPAPSPTPKPTANPSQPQPGYTIDISDLPNKSANGGNTIQVVLNIVFGVIGALSLLMVTIGGFRYINSSGDPQKATSAKNTIMYALIGLVVSVSAVSIVTFVLGRVG